MSLTSQHPTCPPKVCDGKVHRGQQAAQATGIQCPGLSKPEAAASNSHRVSMRHVWQPVPVDESSDSMSDGERHDLTGPQLPKPTVWDWLWHSWLRSRTRRVIFIVTLTIVLTLIAILAWELRPRHGGLLTYQTSLSVQLQQGTYTGAVIAVSTAYPRALEAFRGIPYAHSTGGANRFRPPQPLTDVVQPNVNISAATYGNYCPQQGGGRGQGEDCLNVNLFRPRFGDNATSDAADMAKLGGPNASLPVVIYVHGGGFNGGSGSERNMASFVAFAETPIIGVSFNYRVGALGFPTSSQAAKEGVANLGLMDQQCLFKWVRRNVAAFGGDPNNVSLMGLSAGSHSIGHHLISYAPNSTLSNSSAPFQKAILESGAATARAVLYPSHPLHEQQWAEFLEECRLSANSTGGSIFDELRALPLSTIVSAMSSVWAKWEASDRWAFQPTIDGSLIPDLPARSWQKGRVLRVPTLTGFNTDDGAMFVPAKSSNASALRGFMSAIVPALNQTDLAALDDTYPDPTSAAGKAQYTRALLSGLGSQFWKLDDAYGHYAYICPVLQTAHFASSSSSPSPVWVYHYAALSAARGAADHGDEAPLVAHDLSELAPSWSGILQAARLMVGYWSRFAASPAGDPNYVPPGSAELGGPQWPQFVSPLRADGGTGQLVLFGGGNDERMGSLGTKAPGTPAQVAGLTARELAACKFWWDRVTLSEGWGNETIAVQA